MYAIISPVCSVPALMAWPPTHTISTLIKFMTSVITGIMKVITRLVKSCVSRRFWLATSKRSSSYFSRPNARTTGSPFNISRAIRFTRSISFCIILNLGIVMPISATTTNATTTTPSTIIHTIDKLDCDTATTPPIAMMGEYSTMR